MSDYRHVFFLMNHFFYGFAISIASSALIYKFDQADFALYRSSFFIDFNCLISGGLIFGAAILVYKTQGVVPSIIESTFEKEDLDATGYAEQKRRFFSAFRSTEFMVEFIVVGFIVFWLSAFPLGEFGKYLMIVFGCLEYACGVYVGRKLFYIAQMLNSIGRIDVKRDIFKNDEMADVITYVNSLSTITMIFTYIHVKSYLEAPFAFDTIAGSSAKMLLALPGVIAMPVVVLFNFYPRTIVKKLYMSCIRNELDRIKRHLYANDLSPGEQLRYLIDYAKLAQDELRNRLRTGLSDLPVIIPIIIAAVSIVMRK